MIVIGLTGGIGTGKSTVAGFLAELGAACMDLDRTAHEVYEPGSQPYSALIGVFGKTITGVDGKIDRRKLGEIVFSDKTALKQLNGIIHPAVDAVVAAKLEESRNTGVQVVVLEAAAMLESGRAWQVDEVWITMAPVPVVLERLKKRSGYSESESLARIHAQMSDQERRRRADIIIDTSGSLADVKRRVTEEWQALLQRI